MVVLLLRGGSGVSRYVQLQLSDVIRFVRVSIGSFLGGYAAQESSQSYNQDRMAALMPGLPLCLSRQSSPVARWAVSMRVCDLLLAVPGPPAQPAEYAY